MWGITLIDSAGCPIERVTVDVPFESLRDCCRRLIETRAGVACATVGSEAEDFEYVCPEGSGS